MTNNVKAMINIDELIKNAMKSRNKVELQAYQNLKAEIQRFKTAKNAKPYDEASELAIISKYCKSLEDAIKQFSEARRDDLVSSYTSEWEVLKKLLPEPVNERQVYSELLTWCLKNKFTESILDNGAPCPMEDIIPKIPKKEMGTAIKHLKSKFAAADGKMISEIVKKYLV